MLTLFIWYIITFKKNSKLIKNWKFCLFLLKFVCISVYICLHVFLQHLLPFNRLQKLQLSAMNRNKPKGSIQWFQPSSYWYYSLKNILMAVSQDHSTTRFFIHLAINLNFPACLHLTNKKILILISPGRIQWFYDCWEQDWLQLQSWN